MVMLMGSNTIPFIITKEWIMGIRNRRKCATRCNVCNKDFVIGETAVKYGRTHYCHYSKCYNIVYITIPDSILEGDETEWVIL